MPDLELTIADHIAWLTLNRPAARNALSPALLESLIDVCETLRTDEQVRVVVVRGSGPVFSAGADLVSFMARLHGDEALAVADLGRRAALALLDLPQISIAAIEGHCIGGGLVLASSCDLRWAAPNAWFSVPELDLGIPLAWGGMQRLIELVGETLAVDLVVTCRRLDAASAVSCGLLSTILEGDFAAELASQVASVAERPTGVLRTTKKQLQAIRAGRFDARADAAASLTAHGDPDSQKAALDYMARKASRSKT